MDRVSRTSEHFAEGAIVRVSACQMAWFAVRGAERERRGTKRVSSKVLAFAKHAEPLELMFTTRIAIQPTTHRITSFACVFRATAKAIGRLQLARFVEAHRGESCSDSASNTICAFENGAILHLSKGTRTRCSRLSRTNSIVPQVAARIIAAMIEAEEQP